MKLPKLQKRTMSGAGIEPTTLESNTLTTRPRPLPHNRYVWLVTQLRYADIVNIMELSVYLNPGIHTSDFAPI